MWGNNFYCVGYQPPCSLLHLQVIMMTKNIAIFFSTTPHTQGGAAQLGTTSRLKMDCVWKMTYLSKRILFLKAQFNALRAISIVIIESKGFSTSTSAPDKQHSEGTFLGFLYVCVNLLHVKQIFQRKGLLVPTLSSSFYLLSAEFHKNSSQKQ